MNKLILEQLLNQQVLNPTSEDIDFHESVNGNNKKLNRTERLIFIRVFKFLKKKFKNNNQIELAIMLKALFKEADKLNIFEYFVGKELMINKDTNICEYMDLPIEIIKGHFELEESFLNKIGFSHKILKEYIFKHYDYHSINICYKLRNIKDYILDAKPAALVQMNKRLMKLKKTYKLT